MNGQSKLRAFALSSGILNAINTDCETPKIRETKVDNVEILSTSTPSTTSTATTAFPSPELPGPAFNFGMVRDGSIYRSGFPKVPNFEHMKGLGLKTILTLVDEPYPVANQHFIADNGIMHVVLPIPAHKNTFDSIPIASMERALSVLMDPRNHPVLVHCNKGKHRTGCVVGCYRKMNGSTMEQVIEEYRLYAGHKARPLDEKYIQLFDGESMRKTLECSHSTALADNKTAHCVEVENSRSQLLAFPHRAATI